MSELIDKEKLLDTIKPMVGMWDDEDFWINYQRVLDIIESAESERKWIPVTEALPEKHQRVLVTIKRTDGEMRVRSGNYSDDYFWIDNGDYWKCNEVLAWMPLPEPYRGE